METKKITRNDMDGGSIVKCLKRISLQDLPLQVGNERANPTVLSGVRQFLKNWLLRCIINRSYWGK